MLTRMLILVAKRECPIPSKVTSLSMHSNQLRMPKPPIPTMRIGIDNSWETRFSLPPLGNLTRTQISLATNQIQTLFNLISSHQRKRVKCVNQTPSPDQTFWAKMMELSNMVMVNFIKLFLRERKVNGRVLFLRDLLKTYLQGKDLNKKVLARRVFTETLKDQAHGRRKIISQLN